MAYKTQEKMLKYSKNYYKANKEKYRINGRKSYKNRNLNSRIADNIKNRIKLVLLDIQKSAPTLQLLGCTIDFFKEYIKNQFKDSMSWKNYGKWHLDHIKPCKSFDLSKDYNQEACFHYSNYQPLWAYDNIVKDKSLQSFHSA